MRVPTERVIAFADRLPSDPPVAVFAGDPPEPIDPDWLAITCCSAPGRDDQYVLYFLKKDGSVLDFVQRDLVGDLEGESQRTTHIAKTRWRSCDVVLPVDWQRIERNLLSP